MKIDPTDYFFEQGNYITERAIEVPVGRKWAENKINLIEIGAVLPSYYNDIKHDVVDPFDEKANIKKYLHEVDINNKNVLSLSTVEHIGLDDYGSSYINENGAIESIQRILSESNSCLISVPIGYNPKMDDWIRTNHSNMNTFAYQKTSQNPLIWNYESPAVNFNFQYNAPFLFANMVLFIYK